MKLLVFSEAFLPPAYLPRVRYFCAYFLEKGWEVDCVVEESPGNAQYIPQGVRVISIPYYMCKHGAMAKAEWLLKFGLSLVCDNKGRYFYRKSKPFWQQGGYDAVFTSSFFTFPLPVAARAAEALKAPLFVDLRDIAEQSPDDNHYLQHKPPRLGGKCLFDAYKKICVNRRNKVLRQAAAVTTVSPWHVQTLSQYNPNTFLIYNGFDEARFYPRAVQASRFVVAYFGQVFNERIRNPRLLFECIRNLKERQEPVAGDVVVSWFVDRRSEEVVRAIVAEYGLESQVEFHAFVKPEEVLDEMHKSSVVLVLNNLQKEKRYFGIMTTKFFEAIGANRPVLSIPDNHDNLSQLVRETGCGLASSDVREIGQFLIEKHAEWKRQGYVCGTVNEAVRMDYSRRKGAEMLVELIMNYTVHE